MFLARHRGYTQIMIPRGECDGFTGTIYTVLVGCRATTRGSVGQGATVVTVICHQPRREVTGGGRGSRSPGQGGPLELQCLR